MASTDMNIKYTPVFTAMFHWVVLMRPRFYKHAHDTHTKLHLCLCSGNNLLVRQIGLRSRRGLWEVTDSCGQPKEAITSHKWENGSSTVKKHNSQVPKVW